MPCMRADKIKLFFNDNHSVFLCRFDFELVIEFVSNVCYALLKILRQYEIRYREKHTIYTTKALEEAKIQKAKAK